MKKVICIIGLCSASLSFAGSEYILVRKDAMEAIRQMLANVHVESSRQCSQSPIASNLWYCHVPQLMQAINDKSKEYKEESSCKKVEKNKDKK